MHTESAQVVLVAGATGRFGSILDSLLERGHSVRAMTRYPSSPAATSLRGLGAEIVRGDYEDPASLEAAACGADAVFATGTAHRAGPDGEARHGRKLAAAVAKAGVPHLVFVSGDGAAPDSPLPLFRAKFEVEEAIRSTGVPSTILAPTYLMENLFNPWNLEALQAGILPSAIAVDRPLQQTAIADLLAVAVLAIERPGAFGGRRIAVASDELTAEQAAAATSRVIHRPLEARRLPAERLPSGVRALFGWLEGVGHHVDLDRLREAHPEIGWHEYESWARSQLHRFRELCTHPEPVTH